MFRPDMPRLRTFQPPVLDKRGGRSRAEDRTSQHYREAFDTRDRVVIRVRLV